ncbi:hypothetical protein HNY73_008521 [Argiope bruennichi]|uniref:Uncharacterized protein n=1 Tax=Argiope bruennichi TaxID=94029 RepID=A0A8T0F925_ARGBR|nr:hypothetical protein HNY73_008521 [Argiope bruennichi]
MPSFHPCVPPFKMRNEVLAFREARGMRWFVDFGVARITRRSSVWARVIEKNSGTQMQAGIWDDVLKRTINRPTILFHSYKH